MRAYSLTHLGDAVLTRELAAAVAHERTATAAVLAHLAEFDARRLYLPAGYPSMVAYCLHELHLSEDGAYKRIHAARGTEVPSPVQRRGGGPAPPHRSRAAGAAPDGRECGRAARRRRVPDQVRDRALAGAALPALGAAGAGAAHPALWPAARPGTCAGACRG